MSGQTFAVRSAWIRGVEAMPVVVEISMSDGLPGVNILGLTTSDEREACQRIRCALRACGFENPRKNITVNLSPGGMRKQGSGFDLPIAAAILGATGQIPVNDFNTTMFVGELSLYGDCLAVKGDIAYQQLARSMNLKLVGGMGQALIPLDGVQRGYLGKLDELRGGIEELRDCKPFGFPETPTKNELDYSTVYGQEVAKRGIALAAAGELGLIMVGSPGSGKSMLAERMTSILPEISPQLQQEALCIHSVAGEKVDELLAGHRPFRSPHHSISKAGLVGGGRPIRPGEISLAHGGVLFLDEMAEFSVNVLQALRQPMEQGVVRIVRAEGAYSFPCRFQLLAASNPCPCGNLGDPELPCKCSMSAIEHYQARIRGPLADRIDIMVDIARPDPETIVNGGEGMSSEDMKAIVNIGRSYAAWRIRRSGERPRQDDDEIESAVSGYGFNAQAKRCLIDMARKSHLTGRGISRVCRIARTIADTQEQEKVNVDHVIEAAMYRGRRDE